MDIRISVMDDKLALITFEYPGNTKECAERIDGSILLADDHCEAAESHGSTIIIHTRVARLSAIIDELDNEGYLD